MRLCCAYACACAWSGGAIGNRRHVDAIGDLAIEHYHELANKVTPPFWGQAWRAFNSHVEESWLFRCAFPSSLLCVYRKCCSALIMKLPTELHAENIAAISQLPTLCAQKRCGAKLHVVVSRGVFLA